MVKRYLAIGLMAMVFPCIARAEVLIQWEATALEAPGKITYRVENLSTDANSSDRIRRMYVPFASRRPVTWFRDNNLYWSIGGMPFDTDGDGVNEDCIQLSTFNYTVGLGSLEWTGYTKAEHLAERTVLMVMEEYDGEYYTITERVMLPVLDGDANGDGEVTFADAWILIENHPIESNATWEQGDFNGDGRVDQEDAGILLENYHGEKTTEVTNLLSTMPEPATLVVLGVGGIALLRRRWR